jgi:hypothetical protein
MRRFILAIAMSFVVTFGVAVTVATPAHAAWSSCNAEYVCLYPGTNGEGVPWIHAMPTIGCWNMGAGATNKASSVWNRTGETVWLRDTDGCGGFAYSVLNGGRVSNLGAYSDRVNSVETR